MDHSALAALRSSPRSVRVGEYTASVDPVTILGYGAGAALVVLLLSKFAGERSAASKRALHRDAWLPPRPDPQAIRLPVKKVNPEYIDRLEAWKAREPEAFTMGDSDAF
jgi:hypothetical protein